jgi:hypothetical protein
MGGAMVAVAAIWYLVDQKFQSPSTSLPNDPALQNGLSGGAAAEPNIDELLKAKQPLPPVDPLNPTLPKDAKPPTVTLQKPADGLAAGLSENSTNNKLPTPSRVTPLVLPPSSVSSATTTVPSLRPQQPAPPQRQTTLSTSLSPDRPGALLPNLPDPMERFNSYSSSSPVQSEPAAPKTTQPITEQKPAPDPAAPAKPVTTDTSEDSTDLPSQMPELFTSDPDKS